MKTPSSRNPFRSPLAKKIRERLKDLDLSTYQYLKRQNIAYAQFSEAIDDETNQARFPRDPRLFDIIRDLGVAEVNYRDESSFEELQKSFQVDFKRRYSKGDEESKKGPNLASYLRGLQQGLPRDFHSDMRRFSAEVVRAFSLFEPKDIFVYCSLNLAPWEMKGGSDVVSKEIAEAAVEGCHFIYIFPSRELRSKYSNAFGDFTFPDFEALYVQFIEDLERHGKDDAARITIKKRVFMVALDDTPFFAAHHKYGLYHLQRDHRPADNETFGFGLLPFGTPDNKYHIPLQPDFTTSFLKFTKLALRKLLNPPKGPAGGGRAEEKPVGPAISPAQRESIESALAVFAERAY